MFPDIDASDKRKPWQTSGATSPSLKSEASRVRVRPESAYPGLDRIETVNLNFQANQYLQSREVLAQSAEIFEENGVPTYSEKSDCHTRQYTFVNNPIQNYENHQMIGIQEPYCRRCNLLETVVSKMKLELDSAKSELMAKDRMLQELRFNQSKRFLGEPGSGHFLSQGLTLCRSLPSVFDDFHPALSQEKDRRFHTKKMSNSPVRSNWSHDAGDLPATATFIKTPLDDSSKSDSERMEDVLKFILEVEKLVHDSALVEVLRKCESIISETGVKMPLNMLGDSDISSDSESVDFEIIPSLEITTTMCSSTMHVSTTGNQPKEQCTTDASGCRETKVNKPVSLLKNFFKNNWEKHKYKKLVSQSTGDLTRNQSANGLELENLKNPCNMSVSQKKGGNSSFVVSRVAETAPVDTGCRRSILDDNNMVLWKTCEFCNQVYEESHLEESRLHLKDSHCIVCHQSVSPRERERHIRSHDFIEDLSCSPLP